MIAIWREIETFEITEQRLVDQAGVIRTNEWLTEVELEEIWRKILTPRDGEENQEIYVIPVQRKGYGMKLAQWNPMRQTYVYFKKLKLQMKTESFMI